VAQGRWKTINLLHGLIQMPGGHVLDWLPADGTWRLWHRVWRQLAGIATPAHESESDT
jgi:hypothetical protein